MATTKTPGPNKSEFVRQLLGRNSDTNLKAINAEWKKAGNVGSISNPLFYQVKSKTKDTSTKGSANGAAARKVTPQKPRATGTKQGGPKKSTFVTELLGRNPEANLKVVNEAWNRAGNKGSISSTLVYSIKSKMPSTAGKATPSQPRVTRFSEVRLAPPQASRRNPASGSKGAALDEFEVEIDELIFKLMGVGGMSDVEETLRQARRQLVRHQG